MRLRWQEPLPMVRLPRGGSGASATRRTWRTWRRSQRRTGCPHSASAQTGVTAPTNRRQSYSATGPSTCDSRRPSTDECDEGNRCRRPRRRTQSFGTGSTRRPCWQMERSVTSRSCNGVFRALAATTTRRTALCRGTLGCSAWQRRRACGSPVMGHRYRLAGRSADGRLGGNARWVSHPSCRTEEVCSTSNEELSSARL